MSTDPEHAITPALDLRCAECGRQAEEHARGWRALHGREEPEDQSEAISFCPECAAREFGPSEQHDLPAQTDRDPLSRYDERYPKWTRASINLDLDDFTREEIEELAHGICPACGHVVSLDMLVVDGDEWVVG